MPTPNGAPTPNDVLAAAFEAWKAAALASREADEAWRQAFKVEFAAYDDMTEKHRLEAQAFEALRNARSARDRTSA